jgi:hypothetical protein
MNSRNLTLADWKNLAYWYGTRPTITRRPQALTVSR